MEKYTILIVDDDQEDILNIKDVLYQYKSIEIRHVNNGEEFIHYLITNGIQYPAPTIILLDIKMPKKDGLEALEEVRKNRNIKSIPIIIFTTSSNPEDISHSYQLGANSFITKPIHFEELKQVLKQLTEYWFGIVKLPH